MTTQLNTFIQTRVQSSKAALLGHAICKGAARKFADYRESKDGVAAIEFAFIAPAMLCMYFGLLEISMAISADRKISHATNVVGDLVTQGATINKAEMEDIFQATLAVLNVNPSSLANITVEVSSYRMLDDAGKTRERIGYARLGGPISRGDAVYNPANIGNRLISVNSGAVVARINYKHKPVTTEFVQNVTLHETFMLKPRASETVDFDEGGQNTFMCTAASDMSVNCTGSTT